MNNVQRKFLFAVVASLVVATIFAVSVFGRRPAVPAAEAETADRAAEATAPADEPSTSAAAESASVPPAASAAPVVAVPGETLVARAPAELAGPASLGSLDPTRAAFRLDFAATGAGLERITFADFWQTAADAAAARRSPDDPPAESQRYVLQSALPLVEGGRTFTVPVLGTHSLEIDGRLVSLFGAVWSSPAPGSFVSDVVAPDGTARFRVRREFVIDGTTYEITVRQRVENLTDRPARVRWVAYGPSDLPADATSYIEVRRFHFGYLLPPSRDPAQSTVLATGQMYERSEAEKRIAAGEFTLWPNETSLGGQYVLSWFGATNRYFSLAVHAPWTPPGAPSRAFGSAVESVRVRDNGVPAPANTVLAELHSPVKEIAAGDMGEFDVGVYAGPLDPKVFAGGEPYSTLRLNLLIVYALSGCCTWCTFSWLANFLVLFLTFLHDWVVFDWALAIIVLVIVVRTLLHPIMKRSQIQMHRFSKGMAELKPELDALQKRYKDEPARLQQEQVRLYREKGVNPAGCVGGLLPTFLQTPIWIALYAVLFFAFELRHSPAFFGVFQLLGGWTFLGDLSLPDNFLPFPQPIDLFFFQLKGINVLPILMAFVFFVQQKYLTPPTPNLTPEQEQQQKMMKWMMVLLFPLFLYAAPSGLTLYILTSTCIGIVEGKITRRHIEKYGLDKPQKRDGTPKKRTDLLGRMYEKALERAQEAQRRKSVPTYKDRTKDRGRS